MRADFQEWIVQDNLIDAEESIPSAEICTITL